MNLLGFIVNIPKPVATFALAMLPWTELRVSIPVAIQAWHMGPIEASIISVVGNLVPMVFILYFYQPLEQFAEKHMIWARPFFRWLKKRSHRKVSDKYQKFGDLALCLFVAIPIPGTGVWTGSIAALLLNIKKEHALVFITLGAILSAIIVATLTMSVKYTLHV